MEEILKEDRISSNDAYMGKNGKNEKWSDKAFSKKQNVLGNTRE